MALSDRIKRDAQKVFLRTDHFAEQVVAYPDGGLDDGVTISAQVDRQPPLAFTMGLENNARVDAVMVTVSADPTVGLAAVVEGRTAFDVSVLYGQDQTKRLTVRQIVRTDAGMHTLLLH